MFSRSSFRRFIVVVTADFLYSVARWWRNSAALTDSQSNRTRPPRLIQGISPLARWVASVLLLIGRRSRSWLTVRNPAGTGLGSVLGCTCVFITATKITRAQAANGDNYWAVLRRWAKAGMPNAAGGESPPRGHRGKGRLGMATFRFALPASCPNLHCSGA